MASNGGILEAAEAVAMPAVAVESGPAAGVVAAALVARQTGRLDLLSFDMGGTTAKASLIRDGQYETTPEYEVGGGSSGSRWMHGTGHPIRVPVIDLAEVSAGGGSIAWVDRAGALRVGPKSAGADPGPVCYGRGGTEPTVTDCDLLLGYLDRGSLLGGELKIDLAAAEAAVGKRLAEPLGIDALAAAAAVIDVVNNAMAEALKIVSVQRGHDPRDFALAAFGGAGPLHAAALADELDIGGGGLSAHSGRLFGTRPGRHGPEARLRAHPLSHDRERRSGGARGGLRRPRAHRSRHARPRRRRARAAAVRALGRCALCAPVVRALRAGPGARARPGGARRDRRGLPQSAPQTYGHDNRSEPVQIVSVRVAAIGAITPLTIRDTPAPAGTDALKGTRRAWFREAGAVDVAVRSRAAGGGAGAARAGGDRVRWSPRYSCHPVGRPR